MAHARTVGVEEEFLLVDPDTWQTVPAADDVLARLPDPDDAPPAAAGSVTANGSAPDAGANLDVTAPDMTAGITQHGELRASQVEAATGVCTSAATLRAQIAAGRHRLDAAARAEGVALAAVGTPAVAGPSTPLGTDPQYVELDGLYRGLITDYEGCGCHVHVGVPDRAHAVVAVNRLRPWLPTLLALSVNSPYDRGHDTGYASWRTMQHTRFPTAGIPPRFDDIEAHDAAVGRLVDAGALGARYTTFWLARPSPTLPTVEVRVADTATTTDEALLQALLVRGLVDTALDETTPTSEADPAPEPDDTVLQAALWSAARYGLVGRGVDPWTAQARPATELVTALLEHVRPALETSGDAATVDGLVQRLLSAGTGAQRQRRAAAQGIWRAMPAVAEETVQGLPD